jgi:hypothetical protein
VPAGTWRVVALPDVDGDTTAPVDAACATGSELPVEDGVSLEEGVSVGDVVVTPPPLGLLGVLPPAGDSEDSLTGVVGDVEPEPELDTLTLGVEALTLGVVTLTTGVVTVTLGTVSVTLGTVTDVSPRTGRLGSVTVGSVTVGSVTVGSDRLISGAPPEEEPDLLALEDEPVRDESNPAARALAPPTPSSARHRQASAATLARTPRLRSAGAIFRRLAR